MVTVIIIIGLALAKKKERKNIHMTNVQFPGETVGSQCIYSMYRQ